jgi:hypothetical protein
MRKICSTVVLLGVAFGSLLAQKPSVPTAIGFVNAVGTDSKTDVQIDGKSLKPAGFVEGGYAGSFAVSEGTHQLVFTNPSCAKATLAIAAQEGSSPLYVLYKVTTRHPTGASTNVLKLTIIPDQPAPRAPRFFVFSTLENRVTPIRVNGATHAFSGRCGTKARSVRTRRSRQLRCGNL